MEEFDLHLNKKLHSANPAHFIKAYGTQVHSSSDSVNRTNLKVTQGIKRYTFIFSKDLNVTIKRCCHTLSFVYHCHVWKELF